MTGFLSSLSCTLALCAILHLHVVLGLSIRATPLVDLGYAQYQGTYDTSSNSTSFIGIRYSAPPTGSRRFQAPAAPASTPGVQLANTNPNECYQAALGVNTNAIFHKRAALPPIIPPQSEDCLFLNVWTPGTFDPAKKLPVVVWIHGGGYQFGTMASNNGVDLIRDSLQGAIAVTIQYRLGIFGFLAGNETKQHGALNAGLLDQNFALQWVQNQISKFGGDPSKVTIWGESAGAGSVLQHVVAHGGQTNPPLFRAAMTSSLFLPFQYNYNDPIPEQLYATAVQQAGCASASSTFTCLQNLNVLALEGINNAIALQGFFGTFVWTPVVDSSFIVERPYATLARGNVNGEVVLSVTNAHEGTIFVNPVTAPLMTISQYITDLVPNLSPAQVSTLANAYSASGAGLVGTYNQAVAVMGESIFVCPTYALLGAFSGKAWKGEFTIPPGTHGSDLPYYFDGVRTFPNPQFVASFSESFLQLAKTLNPNGAPDPNNILPQWNTYSSGNTEMLFGMTAALQPDIRAINADAGVLARCQLWYDVAATSPQ